VLCIRYEVSGIRDGPGVRPERCQADTDHA
jgi:hypothetical protein